MLKVAVQAAESWYAVFFHQAANTPAEIFFITEL